MLAFLLTVGLVLFWGMVGYAVLSAIYLKPNLLQNALLAPVVGIAFTMLPIFVVNRLGLPIREFGAALFVIYIALAFVLLWRNRPPVPWRRVLPFALVLLLALIVIALPMFKYGFDWLGHSTDDYANYNLHAHWMFNHGFFEVPIPVASENQYYDPFIWMLFPYSGHRPGAEMLVAWVMSVTGLTGLQAFMPVILAFHIALISAAGALVYQSRRYRFAALLTCLLLAVSAMNTLGTLFQFLAQIPGVALLSGVTVVLFRPFAVMRRATAIRFGLLVGGLTAALMITYPEVTTFLGLAYIIYLVIVSIRGKMRWRLTWQPTLTAFVVAGLVVVVLLNAYVPDFLQWVLGQTLGSARESAEGSEYSFLLLPSGFSNLWGFQAIAAFPGDPLQSILILLGGGLFLLTVAFTLRLTWRMQPVATMTLAMFLAGLLLFRVRYGYGTFKLAMYIQPYLIGVLVVGWFTITRHRPILVRIVPLLLVGLFGIRSHFEYVEASLGLQYGKGPVIAFTSEDGAFSQLEQTLNGTEGLVFRSDATSVLAKMQYLFLDQRPTEFIPMQEYEASRRYSEAEWGQLAAELNTYRLTGLRSLAPFADYFELQTFDLHNPDLPDATNVFYTRRPPIVEQTANPLLIMTTPRQTGINWARLDWFENEFFMTHFQSEVTNYLVVVQSWLGQHYSHAVFGSYSRRELANITPSMFQPESDFFYSPSPMFAIGRHLLFEVVNPSTAVRVRLDFTATFRANGENQLPPATIIGSERLGFAFLGRGSARVYSPPLIPQEIDGHYYVAIDMGDDGALFPKPRQGLMNLFNTDIIIDPRRIVGHARDISVVSEEEYASLNPPTSLDSFPADLANPELEYSGMYEDGWLSETSFFCLNQPADDMQLVIQGSVPLVDDRNYLHNLRVLIDGEEIAQENFGIGIFELIVPSADAGRHCIELHFSDFQRLPGGDNRPTSALLDYIGFQ